MKLKELSCLKIPIPQPRITFPPDISITQIILIFPYKTLVPRTLWSVSKLLFAVKLELLAEVILNTLNFKVITSLLIISFRTN